jgi:hypothetical protein
MEQTRHKDYCRRTNYLEEFILLRDSDFWSCLPSKTRKGILILLDEYRDNKIEDNQAG